MRLIRHYIDAELRPGLQLVLPEHATAHLVRVLRLQVGDAFVLFNGDGRDCDARLLSLEKRGARAEISARREVANESPLRLTLLQAVARGEKMDWIVQKATELGVAAIVPVVSDRTEVRLDGERSDKRLAHWRGVAIAGCEQSGRSRLPHVAEPVELAVAAAADTHALKLALDPAAAESLAALPADGVGELSLAVGPEGGFSERDLGILRAAGYRGVRMGPRILRTETAGIAALALLQGLHGDLR
jgi:16S rRNA (uracil1498-N3)-methyltransferase